MESEVNIKNLFYIIWKRIWIVLTLAILFSIVGGIYSMKFTYPLYESSSRLIVNANPELMNTLMVMIKEPSFLEYVIAEMNLDKTPEELSGQISAGSIGGSAIVKISVIDREPEAAAVIADKVAEVFKREIPNLLNFSDISVLADAKISSNPLNINHDKKIIIGFIVGMILGIAIIFLFDFLDNTIRSERSAEQLLGIPVLGKVSKMNKKYKS